MKAKSITASSTGESSRVACPITIASPRPVATSASAKRSVYGRRSKKPSGSSERRSAASSAKLPSSARSAMRARARIGKWWLHCGQTFSSWAPGPGATGEQVSDAQDARRRPARWLNYKRGLAIRRSGEVGQQVRRVRRPEARRRIPPGRRAVEAAVALHVVVADGDVEEVVGVDGRIEGQVVQQRIDQTQAVARDLGGDCHEPRPLRRGQ